MVRIGIVDDHHIVRTGLRQFLSEQGDLQVTGEATNGRQALDLARAGAIDVLLLDLALPDGSGVETLAAIRARWPDLPVLILSAYPEARYARTLLKNGARAFLNKECDPEEIVRAIRALAQGRRYVSAAVAEQLAANIGEPEAEQAPHEQLSVRELQVFLRLAQGEAAGHVAEGLSLSVKTVSTYRARVLQKLELSTNSDLTYYALKNGLIH